MGLVQEAERNNSLRRGSSLKKYFYVNRTNFMVTVDPEDKSVRKVWGNALSQIVSTRSAPTSSPEKSEDSEQVEGEAEDPAIPEPSVSTEGQEVSKGTKALGLLAKLPYGRPLLRKLGAEPEDTEFKLPSEYASSTDEAESEFDPEAIYILPVIGEDHIFEKRKTIVLRRDIFNAKHIKSTFNIVDKRNKFHFRVEAELYDLKRERVLTDQTGKPTMGLRYDFLKSTWSILAGENLSERRAVVTMKKGIFGRSCNIFVHLPPYPKEFEPVELDGIKPLLKLTGSSIEEGFQIMNIHEDKQWARIQKDLEYLTHWSFGTDSYYVEVEPYIDTALMIAVGIIIEEETTTERERPGITGNLFKDVLLQVANNVYR